MIGLEAHIFLPLQPTRAKLYDNPLSLSLNTAAVSVGHKRASSSPTPDSKGEKRMSKFTMRHCVLSGIFILLFSAAALADTVQGRVASISSSALDMTVYDGQGRPYPNALHLKVDGSTVVSGTSSLAMLQNNDAISAGVSQESSGVWRADTINKLGKTKTVRSTAASPSPSLAGMLGNPVVRNGLMGAATGAIASSASGGKAGKGALVGAGVGIAGGLLADMFSGHSQTQSSQADVSNQEEPRN